MKTVEILELGRGPTLAGSRITVFDALPFFLAGEHHSIIALTFGISSRQVLALQKYFEAHKERLLAENAKIEERIALGNPPEIEERLRSSPTHRKLRKRLDEVIERIRKEENGASHHE